MNGSNQPKTPEQATIRRLRGNSLPMVTAAARAASGEAAWAELIQDLSPEARALVEAPPARETWVDAGLAGECMNLFGKIGNLGGIPGTLGAETIRVRNPEAFRTPQAVVAALPEFWAGSIDGGVVEVETTGPQTAVVRLWAIWDVPLYSFDGHLPAWFTHALRLSGAQDPAVRYIPPPEGHAFLHTYHLDWH